MSTSYRPDADMGTSAGDVLPTADVIAWVKSEAWRRAAVRAFAWAWPLGDDGVRILRFTPPCMALIALRRLCPDVPLWRAARCLGIDPKAAAELALVSAGGGLDWAVRQAFEIAEFLGGGENHGS